MPLNAKEQKNSNERSTCVLVKTLRRKITHLSIFLRKLFSMARYQDTPKK